MASGVPLSNPRYSRMLERTGILFGITTECLHMRLLLFTGILLAVVVLACGCTSSPNSTTPETTVVALDSAATTGAIPDLVGNWTGTAKGYTQKTGFTDYPGSTFSMKVTEQKDRIFTGEFIYADANVTVRSRFGGVVDRDGTQLSFAEENGGYSRGLLVAPDEIELVYVEDGPSFEVAIDTLKRL